MPVKIQEKHVRPTPVVVRRSTTMILQGKPVSDAFQKVIRPVSSRVPFLFLFPLSFLFLLFFGIFKFLVLHSSSVDSEKQWENIHLNYLFSFL